jgi:predicted AlkP superfamily phosphohydrolase/phosphomutase
LKSNILLLLNKATGLTIHNLLFAGGWKELFPFFDWEKTAAYIASFWEQGLYINTKPRGKHGIVNEGEEYESLRDEIIEGLKQMEDPFDGGKLFSRIWKREDIYTGPHLDRAADVFFLMKDGRYIAHPDIHKKGFFEKPQWTCGHGTHSKNGIFIAWGKDLKKGHHFTGARIVDMAPTILYAMGLPIPDDMDGRVLKEPFAKEFFRRNPITYRKVKKDKKKERKGYSLKEESKVIENLKGLGYID